MVTYLPLPCRFIEEHFERMKPLAAVDPLFLQAVVYVCPVKELPGLLKQIPPFVSATWLSSTVHHSATLNRNEVCDCNEGTRLSIYRLSIQQHLKSISPFAV